MKRERLLLTLKGHTDEVYTVNYSREGMSIATSAEDAVRIWDSQTGKQSLMVPDIGGAFYSHDGRFFIGVDGTSPFDHNFQVFDAQTGGTLRRLGKGIPKAYNPQFSPDDKYVVAIGEDFTTRVWLVESGDNILALPSHEVNSARFSPDGKYIVSTTQASEAIIWDARIGNDIAVLDHNGWVEDAAYSPDGKFIAVAGPGNLVTIWNAQTNQKLKVLSGHTDLVHGVDWHPGGRLLATASYDQTARIWDVENGENLLTFSGHTSFVYSVVWNPQGDRIATASMDHTAKVWDARL